MFYKKSEKKAEKMPQRVKRLLRKCEELRSNAQKPSACQEQKFTPFLSVLVVGTVGTR